MSLIINPYNLSPYSRKANNSASFSNGNYVEFAGAPEHIVLGSQLSISGAFTLSVWANFGSLTDAFICGDSATDYFRLYDDNDLRLEINDIVLTFRLDSGTYSLSTWYHIALVRSAANLMTFYVNGIAQADTETSADNLLISSLGSRDEGDFSLTGSLDEFNLYNAELSGADILTLYGGGTPQSSGSPSLISNLIHSWRMGDGDTYPTITDNIGVVNGIMTNMEAGDIKTF